MAGIVVPRINRSGAKKTAVQDAVTLIEEAGHPEEFLREASAIEVEVKKKRVKVAEAGLIAKMEEPTRLAVEMALHEEQERRALHGELKGLEARWREAEEIAAISDSLLLPEGAEDKLEGWREGEAGAAGA